MSLTQLIYTSRPFGFDATTLDDILVSARRNNRRNGISGALICRSDLYVQMLEGSRAAVTRTFGRILADDRHLDTVLVWTGDAVARMFPDWDMRDDPARSWMWSREAVRNGAARTAPASDFRELFDRVAREPRADHAWDEAE
jgi:hypothetical protein